MLQVWQFLIGNSPRTYTSRGQSRYRSVYNYPELLTLRPHDAKRRKPRIEAVRPSMTAFVFVFSLFIGSHRSIYFGTIPCCSHIQGWHIWFNTLDA